MLRYKNSLKMNSLFLEKKEAEKLIIAVCSQGPGLNSVVDHRFERCAYFILIYSDTGRFHAILNPNIETPGDAVRLTAQFLAEKYVDVVLASTMEEKALAALDAVGARAYTGIKGTVANSVTLYEQDMLTPVMCLSV